MQHVGTTLNKIFAETLHREAGEDAPLLAWPLVCGAKVAQKTSAIALVGGVLTVEVPDPAWQKQLQSFEREYLAKLRTISVPRVNAIKFVVRIRPERPPR